MLVVHTAGSRMTRRSISGVREDMEFADLLRRAMCITATTFDDDTQRDRVLSIALDGVRAKH